MNEIYEFLGKVVAIGGTSAAIAYAVFVFLGRSWLESKFKERLEAYKHEQKIELEQLKFNINTQYNRTSKIHEREIEILPVAWSKLQSAIESIEYFTVPLRRTPNFSFMSKEQLAEYLENSKFQESEKKEIRESENIFKTHQEVCFWYDLNATKKQFGEFHSYIKHNSIFLREDIKNKFEEIDDVMWSAINEKETGHELKDLKMQTSGYKMIKERILPIRSEIECLVQQRLRFDVAD